MAACRFGSPDLVTSLSGTTASPTFAFADSNTNYFGLAGSFTSANGQGSVCSFPTRSVAGVGRTFTYAITPLLVTTSGTIPKTTTCAALAPPSIVPASGGSTTYTGIECPTAIDNQLAPGTYTLRFSQPAVIGLPSISSRVFVIASPTFVTDSVTATILQTATASVAPASAVTTTEYTSTTTETAFQTTTATITGTSTATITACPSSSSVASSSASPSSSSVVSSSSTPTSGVETSLSAAPSSSSSTEAISTSSTPSSSIASSSSSSSAPSPTSNLPVSQNGECGSASGQTCLDSTFGNCCSLYGYCGSTDIYCLSTEGCQPGYGNCITPSPVSTSPIPTSTAKVSPDGSCGGTNAYVCSGSGFGDCCSPYGWCGSTPDHCGAGCQSPFGTCTGSTTSGAAPLPSSTLKVSLDGACGGTTGQTCLGSNSGNCCSEYGFCGSTSPYCSTGCQAEFGTCTAAAKKRSVAKPLRRAVQLDVVKRVVGGAGPDYTYPPVPRTTVTVSSTQVTTVTPSAGIATSTLFGITTTTVSGGVVTITETGGVETVTETATATAC